MTEKLRAYATATSHKQWSGPAAVGSIVKMPLKIDTQTNPTVRSTTVPTTPSQKARHNRCGTAAIGKANCTTLHLQ